MAIADTMSPAPPTAANRRSGPWLLEKLRMWTVWVGSHLPRLTSGAPEISLEWSSSTMIDVRVAQQLGERLGPNGRDRDTGRVVRTWLHEERRVAAVRNASRRPSTGEALGVDVDRDHLAPELLEQVEHRRERGVLDDDPVAEAEHVLGDAIERVHRPVDDGHRLRSERPQLGEHGFELRQHRMVEVARRQRLAAHAGDDRPEVGQQRRVGGARRQIELEVPGALRDPSIATRLPGTLRSSDEGAVASPGLDRTDVGETAPGVAHGRRRDAEPAGEVADRRQT